jgi:hypothetical protein
MCDYSLEHYRSRPAQLGEKYETHRFESRSIGFIAPGTVTTWLRITRDESTSAVRSPQGPT